MHTIKSDLKSGDFSNVYLLCGDEEFLRDYYKNALIDKLIDKDALDFNFEKYDAQSMDNIRIEDFLNSYPCMSERKVVYIKDSGLFKKMSEENKVFWARILSDMPSYAVVIFSEKSVDKRNSIYKLISKNFCCAEYPYQKRPDLTGWVARFFMKYKKEISGNTIEYFLDSCSDSMYLLKSEMEKLIHYKKEAAKITNADIDLCCCKIPESKVFAMLDDLLAKKFQAALEKLTELKLLKEEPIAINAAIFSKFSQFRKEKLLEATCGTREIAAKTGQKEYFVKLHLQQIRELSLSAISNILELCAQNDYKIKAGLLENWTAIELTVAEICNFLKN